MNLSIIIPLYNVEAFIAECLESLVDLEVGPYEVVVVDDGSTDRSADIAESFQGRVNNLRVIRHSVNRGLSIARNTGIEASKGRYLFFLDSDDYIKPREFERFVWAVVREDLDLGAGWRLIRDGEDLISEGPVFQSSGISSGIDLFSQSVLHREIRIEVWLQLIRRELLIHNNIRFVEGILHEDVEFTPRVYARAARAQFFDIPFYVYRQRHDSIMTQHIERRITSLEQVLSQYREYFAVDPTMRESNLPLYFSDVVLSRCRVLRRYSTKEKTWQFYRNFRDMIVRSQQRGWADYLRSMAAQRALPLFFLLSDAYEWLAPRSKKLV